MSFSCGHSRSCLNTFCSNNASWTKRSCNVVILLQGDFQRFFALFSVIWTTNHRQCSTVIDNSNELNCWSVVWTNWSENKRSSSNDVAFDVQGFIGFFVFQRKQRWQRTLFCTSVGLCCLIETKTTSVQRQLARTKTEDASLKQRQNVSIFGINARRACEETLSSWKATEFDGNDISTRRGQALAINFWWFFSKFPYLQQ